MTASSSLLWMSFITFYDIILLFLRYVLDLSASLIAGEITYVLLRQLPSQRKNSLISSNLGEFLNC